MPSNERFSVVSLVVGTPAGPATRHGLSKVRLALQAKGVPFEEVGALAAVSGDRLLVVGVGSNGIAGALLQRADLLPPQAPESLLVHRTHHRGKPTVVVSGGDDRGLMYALLDIADRIGWAENPAEPFSEVNEVAEAPAVVERAFSIYTMHHATFECRFHDEAYWARYFDMLARNRFNTFALLFAYESSGYFAPPYPYFFDVEGFPDVHVVGLTKEGQQRNLTSLNRLIAMAHERGLNFTLGLWDHIYRGGVQRGPEGEAEGPLRWRVSGVMADNLFAYTQAALTTLLKRVPNLDAIQFRMHGESGLKREEMDAFWEMVYDVMLEHGRGIRFDARAKGFPDRLIDRALEKGVPIRICTKYWMEQMGLPFHPTHVHPQNQRDRRHGYADLLRYPKRYDVHWRLWNGGTARVLLWGDPDYVRRFAQSTHLYDGEGFEVNEPLATKMAGHPHEMEPFELLNPRYRYYDWEFERYWHFFQTFGRLGYNPQTPPEVWKREFQRRFGPAAEAVERGLHLASRILPRIVAYNYPYNLFPTTRGWIEKQRMEDLPKYAAALPSDTQQFLSIGEAVQNRIGGTEDKEARIHPLRSGAWFAEISRNVLAAVEEAENRIGDARSNEFIVTMVDLKLLAYLALYHARRVHAGFHWAAFERTGDLNALDDAIYHERQAISAWEQLVAAAGDVYCHNLMMGRPSAGLAGHWKDELARLKEGLEDLERQRRAFQPPRPEEAPHIAHFPVRRATPGEALTLRATVSGASPIADVHLIYSHKDNAPNTVAMEAVAPYLYRAVIPGATVTEDLTYAIEAVDRRGRRATFPAEGATKPITVKVTADETPPKIVHTPILSAPVRQPLTVTANVRHPAGVAWVRLRYRSVTQFEEFRSLPMQPTGQSDRYQATVPGDHLDPTWDFMYLIEAMAATGVGTIYPDLERETPYLVVRLER